MSLSSLEWKARLLSPLTRATREAARLLDVTFDPDRTEEIVFGDAEPAAVASPGQRQPPPDPDPAAAQTGTTGGSLLWQRAMTAPGNAPVPALPRPARLPVHAGRDAVPAAPFGPLAATASISAATGAPPVPQAADAVPVTPALPADEPDFGHRVSALEAVHSGSAPAPRVAPAAIASPSAAPAATAAPSTGGQNSLPAIANPVPGITDTSPVANLVPGITDTSPIANPVPGLSGTPPIAAGPGGPASGTLPIQPAPNAVPASSDLPADGRSNQPPTPTWQRLALPAAIPAAGNMAATTGQRSAGPAMTAVPAAAALPVPAPIGASTGVPPGTVAIPPATPAVSAGSPRPPAVFSLPAAGSPRPAGGLAPEPQAPRLPRGYPGPLPRPAFGTSAAVAPPATAAEAAPGLPGPPSAATADPSDEPFAGWLPVRPLASPAPARFQPVVTRPPWRRPDELGLPPWFAAPPQSAASVPVAAAAPPMPGPGMAETDSPLAGRPQIANQNLAARGSREAARFSQAVQPVLTRAAELTDAALSQAGAGDWPDEDDVGEAMTADPARTAATTQVSNTFNVTVAMGERTSPADREALRDTLVAILRDSARRQGIDI
jgi:hypothetical protein